MQIIRLLVGGLGLTLGFGLLGCGAIHNQFREDGPAAEETWDSDTAMDVDARFQPAEGRSRGWNQSVFVGERGVAVHGPLYFEDPFQDKGSDRKDSLTGEHPRNKYRWGWEDFFAVAYSPARLVVNTLGFPVSVVVIPPWTQMESDGEISKQLFFRDHDATWRGEAQREAPASQPAQ